MSTHATPGAAVGALVLAAVVGFAGGAIAGAAAGGDPEAAPTTQNPPLGAPSGSPSESPSPQNEISLTSAQTAVASGERIDLAGTLQPPVAGVTLTVERSVDGGDFETFPGGDRAPITAETAADGTFSTYVQSGREGEHVWRVVATIEGDFLISEEVMVTIS
ncbi:MAG: hypothetical protein ACRDWI_00685 [Jiangellaceae bacterium]